MVYEVTTPEGKCFGRALQKISTRRAHAVWASLVLYAGFAVLLCCPPQVPRFVLGLSIMLKALFFILVLCVLAFAFLQWLFRPTQPTPSERNKPSESSAEKKVRAARAGGRDS
jgi:hypothetical protein